MWPFVPMPVHIQDVLQYEFIWAVRAFSVHLEMRQGVELALLSCHYGIFGDSNDCSAVMFAISFHSWEMHEFAFLTVNPTSLVMIYNEQTFVFFI